MIDSEVAGPMRRRKRLAGRAILTLVSACVAGLTLGGFAMREYDDLARPSDKKAFHGLNLSRAQARQTDSVMLRYACAFDSLDATVAPARDVLRSALKREIESSLTRTQTERFRTNLAALDRHWHQRHPNRGSACGHRSGWR